MKRFSLILLPILFFVGVQASGVQAQERRDWSGEFRIDFINGETLSVSLPLGSEDGLTGEVFFALLDHENRVVTEIFPFEILHNRFWSGPLNPEDFKRVEVGTRAIRITLNQEEIQRIQTEYRSRAASLQGVLARNRREQLLLSYNELEEAILLASNRKMKIRRERAALQEALKGERRDLAMRVDRINTRLDHIRDELGELKGKRAKFADERKKLKERQTPPESRIERLNYQIRDLDEEISEIRESERKFREGKIDAERDAERRGILEIRNELDDLAIDEENILYELEQLQFERESIKRELDSLKQFQ